VGSEEAEQPSADHGADDAEDQVEEETVPDLFTILLPMKPPPLPIRSTPELT